MTPEWPTGTPFLRREFLSCDQAGHWMVRSVSYLPISVVEGNPRLLDPTEEPWPGGIHHQLSTVGVRLGRIEHQATTRTPTSVESYAWGLSIGEPLLLLTEIGWSDDDLEGPPVWVNHIWQPALTAELTFIDDGPTSESHS